MKRKVLGPDVPREGKRIYNKRRRKSKCIRMKKVYVRKKA